MIKGIRVQRGALQSRDGPSLGGKADMRFGLSFPRIHGFRPWISVDHRELDRALGGLAVPHAGRAYIVMILCWNHVIPTCRPYTPNGYWDDPVYAATFIRLAGPACERMDGYFKMIQQNDGLEDRQPKSIIIKKACVIIKNR